PEPCGDETAHDSEHGEARGRRQFSIEQPAHEPSVRLAPAGDQLGFADVAVFGAEYERAQRWNHRQRKHERADERKAVGEGERPEDSTLDALQRENWHERREADTPADE